MQEKKWWGPPAAAVQMREGIAADLPRLQPPCYRPSSPPPSVATSCGHRMPLPTAAARCCDGLLPSSSQPPDLPCRRCPLLPHDAVMVCYRPRRSRRICHAAAACPSTEMRPMPLRPAAMEDGFFSDLPLSLRPHRRGGDLDVDTASPWIVVRCLAAVASCRRPSLDLGEALADSHGCRPGGDDGAPNRCSGGTLEFVHMQWSLDSRLSTTP
ncbi:hypothetical protein ACLOJK_007143 [Asimina triloba]